MNTNSFAKEGKQTLSPKNNTQLNRVEIGPVYTSPVEYKNNIYFISSTGSLFKASTNLKSVKKLFDLKQNSVSGLLIDNDLAFFGDGLHSNELSNFYAFDLKENKIKYSLKVDGHLEKTPVKWNNSILVSTGGGGLLSLDAQSGKILWSLNKTNNLDLHLDSTPLLINNKIFVGSIYKNKKILSINPENGKILWSKDLDLSPKSDLIFYEDKIISLATDGILNTSERLIPSELIILNAKDGTVHFKTKLRGANFFPQLVLNNSLILSLTTGDLISHNFKTNSIVSIDQIAEPFLSSPFKRNENFCAASIMGRIFCYSKDYKKVESTNTSEVIIGDIRPSNNEYYLPTRIGYLKLNWVL